MSKGGSSTAPYDTWAKAASTIALINALNPTASQSHNVYLRAGDTFDDNRMDLASWVNASIAVNIEGVHGDGKTLVGDGKPLIDCNSVQAIFINQRTNFTSFTVKNIKVDGNSYTIPNTYQAYNIYLRGPTNVTIDGVDCDFTNAGTPAGATLHNGVLGLINNPGDIVIQNCTFTDVFLYSWARTLVAMGTSDIYGIVIGVAPTSEPPISTGSIDIHDNSISNVYADSIQFQGMQGPSTVIYSNTFSGWGENALDFKRSSNVDVYQNTFSRKIDGSCIRSNGAGSGAAVIRATLTYNYWLIDGAQTATDAITIRDNSIDTGGTTAIFTAEGTWNIYNNYIQGGGGVVYVYGGSHGNCFNNVIDLNANYDEVCNGSTNEGYSSGISLWEAGYAQSNITIANNTIYQDAGMDQQNGIWISGNAGSSNLKIVNNLIYMNTATSTKYALEQLTSTTGLTVDYNTYYNAGGTSRVYWNGTAYPTASFATYAAIAGHTNEADRDPVFMTNGSDFSLQAGSSELGDGTDSPIAAPSAAAYGLKSIYNWSTVWQTIGRLTTLDGFDRGAYEYFGVDATGTITTGLGDANVSESQIVAGLDEDSNPITIILTVEGTTWDADVGADSAQTTALIAGLDSAQAEAGGWDAKIKAVIAHTAVVRDSDTQVTITIPPTADYLITANETITTTIPASCTASAETIVATPNLTVSNVDPPPDPPVDPVTPTGGMAYSATGTLTVTFSGTGTLNIIIGSP